MRSLRQSVMHCPCGNTKVLALNLCATCYTLKRQDEEHFGGLREAVLERDGYRCRVCDASDEISVPSSFIIGFLGGPSLTSCFPCVRAVMQRFIAQRLFFR